MRLVWKGFQALRDNRSAQRNSDTGTKYNIFVRNDNLSGPFTMVFGNLTAGNNPTGGAIGIDETAIGLSKAGLDGVLGAAQRAAASSTSN